MSNDNVGYHYFLSSHDAWVVHEDLNLGLQQFWKDSSSQTCSIYRVPKPICATYDVSNYSPDVEGTVWIDTAFRSAKSRAEDPLKVETILGTHNGLTFTRGLVR